MIRTLIIGLLLFVVFAVIFAPASLIRNLLPSDAGVELLETAGTLWDGTGDLYLAGQAAGRVMWEFDPMTLTQGTLGYDLALTGPEHALRGVVRVGTGSGEVIIGGDASAAFANRWLAPYDIAITGDLSFREARVQLPYDYPDGGPGAASGQVTWAGGPIRYRLAGRAYSGSLPALVGYLGEELQAVVYPEGGQTPLLRVQVLGNGFVRIGITQLLTNLAGNPWPGSHAEHEVVLEVEEQLF